MYSFNDVADVAVDGASCEESRNQRALVQQTVSPRAFVISGWVLIFGSFVLTLLLNWICLVVFGLGLALVSAYNFDPIRLSGRPVLTQVFWVVTWLLIYVYCAAALDFVGGHNGRSYLVFISLFMGIGESLSQDIRDADNDEAGGRITTVVRHGVPRTSVAAWIAFLTAPAIWLWFALDRQLAPLVALAGICVLAGWIVYSLPAVVRLQKTRSHTQRDRLLVPRDLVELQSPRDAGRHRAPDRSGAARERRCRAR